MTDTDGSSGSVPESVASRRSAPAFEIVADEAVERRGVTALGAVGALGGAVRGAIEGVYVALARRVASRAERFEDAVAERRHAHRARRPARSGRD